MVNTILAKRVNHIVAKGDNPAWPKGSKSRGFSSSRPPQSNLPQDFFITNASKCLCRWSFYLVLPFFSAPLPHPDFGNGIVTQFRFKLAFGRFYLALAKIVKTS